MAQRQTLLLDGPWRFQPDPHRDGLTLGYEQPGCCTRFWSEVTVPSCFEAGCPDLAFFEGVCWYRRSIQIPADWAGRRIVLHFEAVNHHAAVYLNGQLLGEHHDGFLPFEFRIDSQLHSGANVLAVAVDNSSRDEDVPGSHVGWRNFGGIIREVSLEATDLTHLEQVGIVATPRPPRGELTLRLQVRNDALAQAHCQLLARIHRGDDPQPCATLPPAELHLAAGQSNTLTLQAALPQVQPWSPASPALYRAAIEIHSGGRLLDAREATFGFRSVAVNDQQLLLNGQPLFLTGFNRHEDSPRTDAAADHQTTRGDLLAMKQAGANFVRLCHYPHHPAELAMCDELGLLVLAEVPLYFWHDVERGRRQQQARAAAAARQLQRMIERDGHHPSIIIWSVSNETNEEDPQVAADNRRLVQLARQLDPTRLCSHVSNHWQDHPNFAEDDLICINSYPSIRWNPHRFGHSPAAYDPQQAAQAWRTGLAQLRSGHPDKPILVSEFGYFSFAGTRGHALGEDEHARVLAAEFAAFDQPYVCGAAVWCWADHAWPPARFLSGITNSPFGVVSRTRRKLLPLATISQLFKARHSCPAPASPPAASGNSVVMIRPHLRDLPEVSFAAGYGVRPMTRHDIGLWTDIWRDAESCVPSIAGAAPFPIGQDLFLREFGDDLEALSRRCFLITDPRGLAVGTISAWYDRDFHGRDVGRIHWVAVRPSAQGKGLGRASLAYALRQLAQWHDECYLVTATNRVAAIHLYLNLGFEPDLSLPGSKALWQELSTRFRHQALEQALDRALA